MKTISSNTSIPIILLLLFIGLSSCEDYLEKTPESDISEEEIFANYESFQGFVDVMYGILVDYNRHALTTGSENGDHSIAFQGWSSARKYATGNYWEFLDRLHSNYWSSTEQGVTLENGSGIWIDGYKGIRIANIALENLEMLNATQEEIDLIKGQAHFFRAYFHWEIIVRWGGIPYIDFVISVNDDMNLPRLNFQQTVEEIVKDMDMAASLLPTDWDNTSVGGNRLGFNKGRATKGAALATKAKALLYAGSPLMVADGGGSYSFDPEYMERAAEAASEVIQLADQGVYSLTSFSEFQRNFATNDGTVPWTDEWIWGKVSKDFGNGNQLNKHGRLYTPGRFGGNDIVETAVQNLIDEFEMQSTGLPYDDPESGYDETDPWSGRDPRFREFILVDGDLAGFDPATKLTLYEGGADKNNVGILSSYIVRKYWPRGANSIDQLWEQFNYATPHIRLADIYLIYAEAVNEAYGPSGRAPGATLTAIDAVNLVRARSNMPPVHGKFTGNTDDFRKRIWNERSVELFFEGARWNDIRRWYVAHLPEYKVQYDLVFDEGHTTFRREVRFNRTFEQRHYWMPFPRSQTLMYPGWPQNPGW